MHVMKLFTPLRLTCGLLVASLSLSSAQPVFKAGAATSNITPPLGMEIVGNFAPRPIAKHVHDELHVRCLVLDDGTTKLAFAVADTLSLGRDVIAAVGEIHPDVAEAFEIAERVAVLELNLSVLLAAEPKVPLWKPTGRFPSSDLDLAFVVPNSVTAETVKTADYSLAGQVWIQAKAVGVTVIWSGVVAYLSYKIVDMVVGLRVSEEEEREGLDISSHGESAYRM